MGFLSIQLLSTEICQSTKKKSPCRLMQYSLLCMLYIKKIELAQVVIMHTTRNTRNILAMHADYRKMNQVPSRMYLSERTSSISRYLYPEEELYAQLFCTSAPQIICSSPTCMYIDFISNLPQ